jgi:hypothetical protein
MNLLTARKPYLADLLPGFVLSHSRLLFEADQRKRKRPKQSRKRNPPSGGTDG